MTVEERRRHDEDAYENLRTLEILAEVDAARGHNTVERVFNLLRFTTRIRKEAPELFAQIVEFARRGK